MKSKRLGCFILAACCSLAASCNIDFNYLVPAAIGQFDLLRRSVPIDVAIASGDLTDEQLAKLALIQDVRQYAGDVLGLNIAGNYETFFNSGDDAVAYNLSASLRYAFEPKTWTFPIVGTVPYLGFFDLGAAEDRVTALEDQGYDTFTYEIDAYSSVGFLSNPVLSPMLDRDELDLVDTVIHELLHSTIWRANDTSFNESLATFYGRRGALSYFADRYPNQPERLVEATERFEDTDTYSAYLLELYNELDAFYARPGSHEEKITGREPIFQSARDRYWTDLAPELNDPDRFSWITRLPSNNAWMLGVRRYNLDLNAFERAFEAAGEDWTVAQNAFRAAAASDDPYGFLASFADSDPATLRLVTAHAAENHTLDSATDPAAKEVQRGPCVRHAARTLVVTD